MRPQRVLFIGGSGIISSACSRAGGRTRPRPDRPEPRTQQGPAAARRRQGAARPTSGTPQRPARRSATSSSTPSSTGWPSPPTTCAPDLDLFEGRSGQYVFISSASAYQTPPRAAARDGVDAAAQPVLAVLPRQDRLRGPARRGVPRAGPADDDRAAVPHLRPHRDPARRRAGRPSTGCARASRWSCTVTAPRCGR